MTDSTYSIAAVPGDGIGNEVVPEARRVLDRAGALWGFELPWREFPWGCEYYTREGRMMADDGLDRLAEHDAVFLGAVGHPDVADHVSLWGLLIPIRRRFRQNVNVRPIRLLPGIEGPVRGLSPGDVDMVVVRENNEGEYSEIGGRIYHGLAEEIAIQESVFTRHGVTSVLRYGYDLARSRSGRLASATKSNGIVHTMPFWDEVCWELAAENPQEIGRAHV